MLYICPEGKNMYFCGEDRRCRQKECAINRKKLYNYKDIVVLVSEIRREK